MKSQLQHITSISLSVDVEHGEIISWSSRQICDCSKIGQVFFRDQHCLMIGDFFCRSGCLLQCIWIFLWSIHYVNN